MTRGAFRRCVALRLSRRVLVCLRFGTAMAAEEYSRRPLSFRAGCTGGEGLELVPELAERGPAGVELLVVVAVRIDVQVAAAQRAEARTVDAA